MSLNHKLQVAPEMQLDRSVLKRFAAAVKLRMNGETSSDGIPRLRLNKQQI
jgi:hypothetical protein